MTQRGTVWYMEGWFTKKELIKQGWTLGQIKLLGKAEKQLQKIMILHRNNLYGSGYKCAYYVNYWKKETVDKTRKNEKWIKLEKRKRRI